MMTNVIKLKSNKLLSWDLSNAVSAVSRSLSRSRSHPHALALTLMRSLSPSCAHSHPHALTFTLMRSLSPSCAHSHTHHTRKCNKKCPYRKQPPFDHCDIIFLIIMMRNHDVRKRHVVHSRNQLPDGSHVQVKEIQSVI